MAAKQSPGRAVVQRLLRVGGRAILGVDPARLRRMLPTAPRTPEGVPLDEATWALVRANSLLRFPATHEVSLARGRDGFEAQLSLVDVPAPDDVAREERSVDGPAGGVPVTVFRRRGSVGARPGVVFFHGGGWVIGSPASHAGVCAHLAKALDVAVLSVDYRLAPEHPYPAAAEDAVAAFRQIAARADEFAVRADRLAVAGDSAGGNLSAVVAQQTARDAVRPCFQLLIYPATDITRAMPSHRHFRSGYLLEGATVDWYIEQYCADRARWREPMCSPLFADDVSGLAPAMVMVAEFDPLRDEGVAYAESLRAAGVPVDLRRYPTVHGFFNMAGALPLARVALDDAITALRAALCGG